ncbi:MAG: RNA polymerase sigma factor [Steroidobacteraceae bacterium]
MSRPSSLEDVRSQLGAMLPQLRRFARVITRRVQDADDLVQVAIDKALTHADQWRPESRLESWTFGIMKNAWIDEIRARSRRARGFAPEKAGLGVGDRSAEDRDNALFVEAAMARVPEEQRLAVALVLIEGLSYKEAAATLAIPVGTLTSQLAQGRETLESLLDDAWGAP